MKLYLLRHGIAVERSTAGYADDSQRTLTSEGKEKLLLVAQGMRKLKLSFDLVLSSPYLRALETATIVLNSYKLDDKELLLTEGLIPEAPPEAMIKEINSKFSSSKSILLVGHEPHLSQFTSFLLAGHTLLNIDFKKGGLCSLSMDKKLSAKCASLNWLLTPSQLKEIA